LALRPHGSPQSVQDLLQDWAMIEQLEDSEWLYCEATQRRELTTRRMTIAAPSPWIIFHLKRFSFDEGVACKNSTEVEVNSTVDLRALMDSAEPALYALDAVVTHLGEASAGHYVAQVATDIGYVMLDDASVSPQDTLQSSNGSYLLLYKRRTGHLADPAHTAEMPKAALPPEHTEESPWLRQLCTAVGGVESRGGPVPRRQSTTIELGEFSACVSPA
jgi:hypothetical protein